MTDGMKQNGAKSPRTGIKMDSFFELEWIKMDQNGLCLNHNGMAKMNRNMCHGCMFCRTRQQRQVTLTRAACFLCIEGVPRCGKF